MRSVQGALSACCRQHGSWGERVCEVLSACETTGVCFEAAVNFAFSRGYARGLPPRVDRGCGVSGVACVEAIQRILFLLTENIYQSGIVSAASSVLYRGSVVSEVLQEVTVVPCVHGIVSVVIQVF